MPLISIAQDTHGLHSESDCQRHRGLQILERQPCDNRAQGCRDAGEGWDAVGRIIRTLWQQGPKNSSHHSLMTMTCKEIRERRLYAGMNGYISNPVKMGEMAKVLRDMDGRRI